MPSVTGDALLAEVAESMISHLGWLGLRSAATQTQTVDIEAERGSLRVELEEPNTAYRRTYPHISKNVRIINIYWKGDTRATTQWHVQKARRDLCLEQADPVAWWGTLDPEADSSNE